MSIHIIARFYFKDDLPSKDETLCTLARTFATNPNARSFTDFSVFGVPLGSTLEEHKGEMLSDELCRLAKGKMDTDTMLMASSSLRCWRFSPGSPPEDSGVVLSFESWGQGWARRRYADLRICGQAAITVYKAGAFQAFIEQLDDPGHQEVNARVEENLENLTKLLIDAVNVLKPSSMKVYTDKTMYLPFNAHMAYYRDESAVIDDLQLIADVWQHGLPSYNTAPLMLKPEKDMGAVFGRWRTAAQRESAWQKLNALLPPNPMPAPEDIRAIWSSGRFDNYEMPVGIMLLDYPHYMNAYLDRFYWEVLERAAARVPTSA